MHSGQLDRISALDWHQYILASGSRDGHVAIWDMRMGKSVYYYKCH